MPYQDGNKNYMQAYSKSKRAQPNPNAVGKWCATAATHVTSGHRLSCGKQRTMVI